MEANEHLLVGDLARKPIEEYLNRTPKNYGDIQFFKEHNIVTYFFKQFNSHIKQGLKSISVDQNRKKYGSNAIPKRQQKSFCEFLKDALCDEMLVILMIASVISIVLQGIYSEERSTFWVEGVSILFAVAVCSIVASINDYEKQKQFQEINSIQDKANNYDVIRNGERVVVHIDDIVVGDLIVLESGMEVPVDGFLVEAINIIVDESSVTGESQEIYKDTFEKCLNLQESFPCPSPVIVSSSKIKSGEGKMLSVVVGPQSQLGKIQRLIHNQQPFQTPLQEKLEELAGKIGYFGLYSAIFIFIVLCIRLVLGDIIPEGWNTGRDIPMVLKYLIISVSIIVVAIPEGLPLAVTLSLAFSVKKMLSDKNLVRKLASCETMGGANYICTDKTGTLTMNQMWVTDAWSDKLYSFSGADTSSLGSSKEYENLLLNGIFHNSSAIIRPYEKGSPTEIALINFAEAFSRREKCENFRERATESGYFLRLPFNSDRKRMTTGVFIDEKYILFTKGAAQIILDACDTVMHPDGRIKEINREEANRIIQQMAVRGLRAIALAYKQVKGPGESRFMMRDSLGVHNDQKSHFCLLMIAGLKDILRKETPGAIEQCKKAGINVIMVTGDNITTARAIASEAGILTSEDIQKHSCILGNEFQKTINKNEEFSPQLRHKDPTQPFVQYAQNLKILARSRPEHKYMLVQGLRKLGNIVAVTGDGTNDVPALLKADVGFAMGVSGTQVARNAADIIILDDNFDSIVSAVVWGRNIYDSIRKFLQFQLTVNVVAVGLSIVSAALIRQSVLTAIQMLWVNLIMDSLASLALATEPPNRQALLNRTPHSRRQSLISSRMAKHIIGQAIFQFTIIMVLLFMGQQFIPEERDAFDSVIGTDFSAKYHNGIPDHGTVVNGAFYKINGEDSYFDYFQKYHVYSRHFTFIFNTFVMMQVFNFFNCRRIHDQLNLLEGFFNNWIYIAILIGIVGFQVIVVELLNVPFKLYSYGGLTSVQWLLSVLIGTTVIPVSIVLRLIPYGKEAVQEQGQEQEVENQAESSEKADKKGYSSIKEDRN